MESKPVKDENAAPKKVRFVPKAPQPRKPKPNIVKSEIKNEPEVDDDFRAKELLQRFNESMLKGRPKIERKVAPSQIAFGYGGASSTLRSYPSQRGNDNVPGTIGSSSRELKEYREPWDYYSNYPATLPLRRPYSGNPELLDKEEFRDVSDDLAYDEDFANTAEELGLREEKPETNLFFLQLPPTIPMMKRSATAESNDKTESSKSSAATSISKKGYSLAELPGGFMGKMVVYKSGVVKLKLGDTVYDVSSGMDCVFAQDVVTVNTVEKKCCTVGEISKRVILTPDIDSVTEIMKEL